MMNEVLDRGDFYLSYNPGPDPFWDSITGFSSGAETAIVKEIGGKPCFYILNGDHRLAMKTLSYAECIAYWRTNQHLKSDYSEIPKEALS